MILLQDVVEVGLLVGISIAELRYMGTGLKDIKSTLFQKGRWESVLQTIRLGCIHLICTSLISSKRGGVYPKPVLESPKWKFQTAYIVTGACGKR